MTSRRGRLRRLLDTAVLTFACVALAPTIATAREVPAVLPGQRLWGEVGPQERLTVVLDGLAGMELTVRARAFRGSDLLPALSLVDPDGVAVPLSTVTRESHGGRRVTLRRLTLEQTGLYELAIEGVFGTTGGFDLRTTGRMPRSVSGSVVIEDGDVAIPFDARPGDTARLRVRKGPKSPVLPIIRRFVDAAEIVTDLQEPKRSPALPIGVAGTQRFEVGGRVSTRGEVRYRLRVKRTKAPKEPADIRTFHAAGTVSGRIVIAGNVVRSSRDASAKGTGGTPAPDLAVGELVIGTAPGVAVRDLAERLDDAVAGTRFIVERSLTPEGPHLVSIAHLAGVGDDARRRAQTVAVIDALADSGVVAWAEPNHICRAARFPDDPGYRDQYPLTQMSLDRAWEITRGDSSIVIAVLDTGTWPHPDLDDVMLPGFDFVSDRQRSFDFDGWDSDPTDSALDYHGTHVAGIAAASTNNGIGVAGVAWGSTVLPVRVLGKGGGTDFDLAAGIRWAAGLAVTGAPINTSPAEVINMSLVSRSPATVVSSAVDAAFENGVALVAAAGNAATSAPYYPAAYPPVVSVYALDVNYKWASYSNYGSSLSVGAPGGDMNAGLPGILSTYVDSSRNASYAYLQGTSMACPHVAGVMALLRTADRSLTPVQVTGILETTAIDLGPPGFDDQYGYGAVDAYAALRVVASIPPAGSALAATPPSLEFGRLANALDVIVRDVDEGRVLIRNVIASPTGAPWLSVDTDDDQTPAVVHVHVDHEQLGTGIFESSVEVLTTAGAMTIPVRVIRTNPPRLERVRVSAIDALGIVRAQTQTSEDDDWEYVLPNVPLGQYRIVAGADLDLDLAIDRVDEFEGEWPLLERPERLGIVVTDLDHDGIDVPLLRRDARFAFDGVGGGPIDGAVAVRVYDRVTGLPIAGARVYLADGGLVAQSDLQGRAVFAGVFEGALVITVVAAGYEPRTRAASNSQYQAFGLVPAGDPGTVTVTVRVSGLEGGARDVVVHVGSTRVRAAWNQSPTQTVEVIVPRTVETFSVSAFVTDIDGRPTHIAVGSVTPPRDGDAIDIDLAVVAPEVDPVTRSLEVVLPASRLGADAEVRAFTELATIGEGWVVVGESAVDPDAPSEHAWTAALGGGIARLAVTATDSLGRSSRLVLRGAATDIRVDDEIELPVPGAPLAPIEGATVSPNQLLLEFEPTLKADIVEIEMRDVESGETWHLTAVAATPRVTLPDLPEGGLRSGRTYAWRVISRRFSVHSYAAFVERDLRANEIERTVSREETFTTE